MQMLATLKNQTIELLKYIIEDDESHLDKFKEHERSLLENYEIRSYDPTDRKNFLRGQEAEFENLCLLMENNGFANPKQKTVKEWFHAVEYLEQKARSNNKTGDAGRPQPRSNQPKVKRG